jgi:hypothetical protein
MKIYINIQIYRNELIYWKKNIYLFIYFDKVEAFLSQVNRGKEAQREGERG